MDSKKLQEEPLLLDAIAVAKLLSVSRRHVQAMDCNGRLGPQGIKLGRSIRWRRDEIVRWVEAGCPPRAKWIDSEKGKQIKA